MENGSQTDIILLIAAGCMGMLILVVSIILFVVYYQKKVLAQKNDFQKQLLSATVQVEEKERERIAKNIHDDVGILLTVLKQNISKAYRNLDDKKLQEELNEHNKRLLDDSMQTVREAAKDLSPKNLTKYGYAGVIRELCTQLNKGEKTNLIFVYEEAIPELPQKISLQLYRITKELLNNVIKHAHATEINMKFGKSGKNYRLSISHNGKGIGNEEVRKLSLTQNGLGLKSLESRAQLINSRISYDAGNKTKNPQIEVLIDHE